MFFKALALVAALTGFVQVPSDGYEQLQGFSTVLVNQINAVLGSENLPSGMGLPVEPGLYVTLAPARTMIFDKVAATVQGGRYADQTRAAECQSGCARSIYDAFYFNWRSLAEESAAIGIDIPSRVLFAADQTLPAKHLIETAYAAAETKPGAVPYMSLVVNGGQAGVRARPFSLVPPTGLVVPAGQRVLGLTVRVEAGARYRITAADPRFARTLDADAGSLLPTLKDIKKRYPSKETLIIDAGDTATVGDVVALMLAAQEFFPKAVLSAGAPVRVGG